MKNLFPKLLIVSLVSLSSVYAFAGALEGQMSDKSIQSVALYKTANLNSADGSSKIPLTEVGAALRGKKLGGLIPIKVYVAQLLVSQPDKFIHKDDQALGSLGAMSSVAIQLHFLHAVTKDQYEESLSKAFASNQISQDNPVAKQILDLAHDNGDIASGATVTYISEVGSDGREILRVESAKGEIKTLAPVERMPEDKLSPTEIMLSLWLGTLPPDDKELLKFKSELVSGTNL